VISGIISIIKALPFEIHWEHAKGHQDAVVSEDKITRMKKLNILADTNATIGLGGAIPQRAFFFITPSIVELRVNSTAITSHFATNLRQLPIDVGDVQLRQLRCSSCRHAEAHLLRKKLSPSSTSSGSQQQDTSNARLTQPSPLCAHHARTPPLTRPKRTCTSVQNDFPWSATFSISCRSSMSKNTLLRPFKIHCLLLSRMKFSDDCPLFQTITATRS
jgi:hypothetical protein